MNQTSNQPPKKTVAENPAAKVASTASNVANKAAKETYAAVATGHKTAENVVKIGGNAVKDFVSTSTDQAKQQQEKALAYGREGIEKLSKTADTVSKAMQDMVALSRDNLEACIECGNMTAALGKDVSTELFGYVNKAFSDQVETSKDFFSCRTINDMFDLQNRIVKNSIDNFFNQSVKLSGMLFEYASEALEPINERMTIASERLSKTMSAA